MPKNAHISTAASSLSIAELATLLTDGQCLMYSGTQPAFVEEPVVAQVLIAEIPLGNPGFVRDDYTLVLNVPVADLSANASGVLTWFRLVTSAGVGVMDGSMGTADANLIVNVAQVPVRAKISITSLVINTQVGASPSASPSISPSYSLSLSPSASPSQSLSPSSSESLSPSVSESASPSISVSPSASESASPSVSVSPSASTSASPSYSPSSSPSLSPSSSPSVSPSPS